MSSAPKKIFIPLYVRRLSLLAFICALLIIAAGLLRFNPHQASALNYMKGGVDVLVGQVKKEAMPLAPSDLAIGFFEPKGAISSAAGVELAATLTERSDVVFIEGTIKRELQKLFSLTQKASEKDLQKTIKRSGGSYLLAVYDKSLISISTLKKGASLKSGRAHYDRFEVCKKEVSCFALNYFYADNKMNGDQAADILNQDGRRAIGVGTLILPVSPEAEVLRLNGYELAMKGNTYTGSRKKSDEQIAKREGRKIAWFQGKRHAIRAGSGVTEFQRSNQGITLFKSPIKNWNYAISASQSSWLRADTKNILLPVCDKASPCVVQPAGIEIVQSDLSGRKPSHWPIIGLFNLQEG